jgi:hypothetical protein
MAMGREVVARLRRSLVGGAPFLKVDAIKHE